MKISQRIESIIINRIDWQNGNFRYFLGKRKIGSLEKYKETRNIYYLMAPAFGNIGDEAIVEASIHFLNDMYPGHSVIVIDFLETLQTLKEIRRILKKEDFFVLQGGGNIGTLYYHAEQMREFIIKKFPDVAILSMPQSMYFADTVNGAKKLNRCKKIYNAHPNLTLIAREKYTYKKMKQIFTNCKVIINPDIVFYLSKEINTSPDTVRGGIMTCLRTDKEDVLGDTRYDLIRALAEKHRDLIISDTCVPRNIPEEIRRNEVASLINQFRRFSLVITDRLHGMVLAALTDTPCLVMPSMDQKIIGTYEWIQDIDFIKFVDKNDVTHIINLVEEMLTSYYKTFDWSSFREKYFDNLRTRIEEPKR